MKFSKEEKTKWVEDWKKSGKKVWPYAQENGICPQTFTRWIKPRKKNKPRFVEVTSKVRPSLEIAHGIIIEKGETKIHVMTCIKSEELRILINALKDAL
jgi:hypothetical protein